MRGAAMSLTAAASGFVVFLLSVSVVQGQNDWGVTYTSTQICALKGSTVDINCTYRYPTTMNGHNTIVQETFWFTNASNNVYVNLKTDSEYSGRVQYICDNNNCTLRITDLRESDSAVYKFRFITNQHNGKYFGSLGVTLSVADLQVQVNRLKVYKSYNQAELTCQSSCLLPGHPHYIWHKNGQNIQGQTSNSYSGYFNPADKYSCAVEGYEKSRSPPVHAPRVEAVSVSPSGEIVENSSVSLNCSIDANPADNYTWYKKNGDPDPQPLSKEAELVFISIQSSDSGEYYCTTRHLTFWISKYISISVKSGAKGAGGKAAAGAITVVLLAILSLSVFLWIRKKRASKPEERPGNREQGQLDEQGDLQYAAIHFSNNQADSLYSNIRAAQPQPRHMERQEVVEYAAVKFNSA